MTDLEHTHELDWRDYMQVLVDELQSRKAALPTERNITQWTRVGFLRDVAECHQALSDVLRCIVEN